MLAAGSPSPVVSIGLIALAGILVGGAWAAREHSVKLAIGLGLCAAVALAGGILWQLG